MMNNFKATTVNNMLFYAQGDIAKTLDTVVLCVVV